MAQLSVIQASRVASELRWDADYYSPANLLLERTLQSHPDFCHLGSVLNTAESCYGVLPKSKDYLAREDNSSSLFLCRGEDVRKNCLNFDEWIKVPEAYVSSRCSLRRGDLLILVKGKTIDSEDGVAWISEKIPRAIYNGSVFRVALRTGDPRYYYAFFRTRYFTQQKRRLIANATVEYNAIGQIKKYMIIAPSITKQESVARSVETYFCLLRRARDLYREAQNLLDEELGITEMAIKRPLSFSASASEIARFRRSDAEYYDPTARHIVKRMTSQQHSVLGDNFRIGNGFPWKSSKFRNNNSGEPVVRIRNIKPCYIDPAELTSIEPYYARSVEFAKARPGDIVVGMDGIKYFYASLLEGDCYVNQRVCHLTPKADSKISAEFAVLALNSRAGQVQLMRDMTVATTVGHITNRDIAKLIVPSISEKFHDSISALVRQSIDARKESKRLLCKAISQVESLIEEPL